MREAYLRLPPSFEANRGQSDGQVKFLSRGPGYTLFLTPTEAVFVLSQPRPDVAAGTGDAGITEPVVVRTQLLGANPAPQVLGLNELPGRSNYFIGNDPRNWHVDIPTYARVRYEQVYPGIDLVYYGKQGQLEYDFVVHPGADPGVIELGVQGARELTLDPQGDLIVHTAGGELTHCAPVIYQEIDGRRQFVPGGYDLKGPERVGFATAAYDSSRPLVIDPSLRYSTFLGGSSDDRGLGIAVDGSGNAYVTGFTGSTNFPTANALQPSFGGGVDVFVTKVDASGSALVYSTFLGGSAFDEGVGIAVDGSGNAYVTGATFSSDFPTANALQPAFGGGRGDVFVTKVNADGSALAYSTYLGGSGGETTFGGEGVGGIAVDGSGNAYVTGLTDSADFPTANALQPVKLTGRETAFVTKVNAAGSALVYSTFLGGSTYDQGYGIAVDGSGNAYVTGLAASPDFPTANALQPAFGGGEDAFVTKVNAAGSALVYSTFLGGSSYDRGLGIAVDGSGNAYVTGFTGSTNFPTANALQPAFGGGDDAFVTKVNADGSALAYSTYLGGNAFDRGFGIAVDGSGNAYVTGFTGSTNFPTANALQPAFGGGDDAFVTKVNADGSALAYSTYLGGNAFDRGFGIAVDGSGNAYVTGLAASPDFPTANALQPAFGGGFADAFVTKVNADGSALVYSTFLGGSGGENLFTFGLSGGGIAVDGSGNAYVTGSTDSADFTTANALQPALNGGVDAFVAKIAKPQLIVIKHVINDNGGTATAADFMLTVTGDSPFPASFPGAESPGTTVTLNAGAYSVDEASLFGYTKTLSADCSGSITVGETKTCTVTNDDIADVEWIRQFGTLGLDRATGVSVDASGIYVAGFTDGTLPGQTSAGGRDAFVHKYDAAGNEVWTRQFGTASEDFAFGVSVDASGVFVAGATSGTFPGQTSTGGRDAFVRKYDAAGNEVWTRQFGTGGFDEVLGISVSTSGVFVAGETEGTLPGQTSAGDVDAFVRKYDAAGNEVWTRQFGTASSEAAYGVAVDASGVYVAGGIGTFSPSSPPPPPPDPFVRKYDAAGNEVWTRQFGTGGFDIAKGISVDASGVYVAGWTSGTFPGQSNAGDNDPFVRKYDAAGNEVWTRQFGTGGNDHGNGVAVDASGVYVAGDTGGTFPSQTSAGGFDAFVRKYDAAGTELWTRQFGTPAADAPEGISVDASGVYVAGSTAGTLPGQTSAGDVDAFVVKLSHVVTSPPGFAIRDDAAGGDCSSIGTWDPGAKTCTLAADVTDGIRIESNDVTLDCAGQIVSGPGAGIGISLTDRTGVTVTNCHVTNFDTGIALANSDVNTLTGNAASGNVVDGFALSGSDSNILMGNAASGNGRSGFFLEGSSSNTLSGNAADGHVGTGSFLSAFGVGFALSGSSGNTFTGNTADGNRRRGFQLVDSSSNFLGDNAASGNGVGFALSESSSGNTLTGNTASGNFNGFQLVDSSGNFLEMNIADGNSQEGFVLFSSPDNTLSGNTATGNVLDGFGLVDSSGNLLEMNTATGNSAGFVLQTSPGNTLTGNAATGNSGDGFVLSGSSGNTLTGNAADGNSAGFFLSTPGSSGNFLAGNTATGNVRDGFLLVDSSGNFLGMNTADGNGAGFELFGSNDNTLTGNAASGNVATGNNDGFVLVDSSGNLLEMNTATGNSAGAGFFLQTSPGNTLTGNAAIGNGVDGFVLSASSGNTLSGNTATGNSAGFFLSTSPNNTLTGNAASGNVRDGFLLVDSSGNVLGMNTADNNVAVGFLLSSSSGNVLEANAADVNAVDGFVLVDSSSNFLEMNAANGNRGNGFFLGGSGSNTLTANTADGNGGAGFGLFVGSSGNTLAGNTATGNANDGFFLGDSSGNVFEMNTAVGNSAGGFALFSSNANTLSGNMATGNNVGFFLGGSGSNTLSGNMATGNGQDGFVLHSDSSGNLLAMNTATGNGVEGFELITSPSNVLSDNTADGNAIGFRLFGSSSNSLFGNTATGNGFYGFVLVDSSGNFLETNTAEGNGIGFELSGSPGNTLTRNAAVGNEAGFALSESSGNTLTSNAASGNAEGFVLFESSSNTLDANTASGNAEGFALSGSSGNTLTRNAASRNGGFGFELFRSSGNTLAGNAATRNGLGFALFESSGNTLTRNTAMR
ncbi:MAG: hypothetical protein A2Z17_01365, partial [Gammaproteobacteria bacterium RBG_16_66_13]